MPKPCWGTELGALAADAAMLHPASEELWKYSELLPHHIPTEAPLNIRLLDPPPAAQAAEPEARPCRTMP